MPIAPKKLVVAKRLAESHISVDQAVSAVYLLEEEDESTATPIKLLEIVEGSIERGIEPVFFLPDTDRGIPYSSVIIELSPREWKARNHRTIAFQGQRLKVTTQLATQ